ncbi:MAG: hypothetical protein L0170_11065 [Acidobacteria bacterium]|nr:hypothetical protein [Acidobacteriota bacterium]
MADRPLERLEGPGRREAWVLLAYLVGAATAGLFLYLGLRPGGLGPIRAYTHGRSVLFLAGAALLCFGLGASLLRRPVLQRGRLGAFLCLGAAVWFSAYPLAYPSSHEGHPSAVCLPAALRALLLPGELLGWGQRALAECPGGQRAQEAVDLC